MKFKANTEVKAYNMHHQVLKLCPPYTHNRYTLWNSIISGWSATLSC